MRIIYFANHGNRGSDDTERHIAWSLRKLGHEVVQVHERQTAVLPHGDLFLFHKGGPNIANILPHIKMPKVFWYFDKIQFNSREDWMTRILPLVDHGFVSDETYHRFALNADPKLTVLRQGIGEEDKVASPRFVGGQPEIIFAGTIYGPRAEFVAKLKARYPQKFGVVNSFFNSDLYDLAASVKVFIAPVYPGDDFYWSSRIYMILGSGGLLVHPRFKGLESEYVDGEHYLGYSSEEEMFDKIEYSLQHPEECARIRKSGQEKTHKDFTYTQRCRKLLATLQLLNTGTGA